MNFIPKPEREYIFSLKDTEFPVYGPDKERIGTYVAVNICDVEKRTIHSYKNPEKTGNKVMGFIRDRISNGLFLQVCPSEECIAMRPWAIFNDDHSGYNGNRYFIIPNNLYRCEQEFPFLEIGSSPQSEAMVLNFSVKSIDDLNKFHSFEMRGAKDRLLW